MQTLVVLIQQLAIHSVQRGALGQKDETGCRGGVGRMRDVRLNIVSGVVRSYVILFVFGLHSIGFSA